MMASPIQINSKPLNVAYQLIRPFLPAIRRVRFNNVLINSEHHFLDSIFPIAAAWEDGNDRPMYEESLGDGLRTYVKNDDEVVIVGGGRGVTAVIAARQTTSTVHVFEAGEDSIQDVCWAVEHNSVRGKINLEHAIVGLAKEVWGDHGGAFVLEPDKLPECNVLELDCEGAELEILKRLSQRPRVILVETHGYLGSSTDEVRNQLHEMGYRIKSCRVAATSMLEMCEENDIRVLTAINDDLA